VSRGGPVFGRFIGFACICLEKNSSKFRGGITVVNAPRIKLAKRRIRHWSFFLRENVWDGQLRLSSDRSTLLVNCGGPDACEYFRSWMFARRARADVEDITKPKIQPRFEFKMSLGRRAKAEVVLQFFP
jgi:hypothetical protein